MRQLHDYILAAITQEMMATDHPSKTFKLAARQAGVRIKPLQPWASAARSMSVLQLCDVLDAYSAMKAETVG